MRQKLRQGPSGLPRGSAAVERRPVSADAISWARHLAPVPAGCGGQPSTACKFRARRPSRPRRAGQHAPVLLRRWLTCQLIWPSLYRGHRVCKFTNLAGGHESRLTPIRYLPRTPWLCPDRRTDRPVMSCVRGASRTWVVCCPAGPGSPVGRCRDCGGAWWRAGAAQPTGRASLTLSMPALGCLLTLAGARHSRRPRA
jgi:hypothetical protein